MKKALKTATFFMLVGAMTFLFVGCPPGGENGGDDKVNFTLSGNISITPGAAEVGDKLTATYTGHEEVTFQWKRHGDNISGGTVGSTPNTNEFETTTDGLYSVVVSRTGYNSKTSNSVSVFYWNAAKPIVTTKYVADPSAHVWLAWNQANGLDAVYNPANPLNAPRLFLYPSRDMDPPTGCNLMDRYHVFSTNNMVDWIDHGEILRRDDLDANVWGPKWDNAMFMWAPDAAYNPNAKDKDGNPIGPYFYYFPHTPGADGQFCWDCEKAEAPATGTPNPAIHCICPEGYSSASWGANWYLGVVWSTEPHTGFDGSKAVKMKYDNGVDIRFEKSYTGPQRHNRASQSRNLGGKLIDPCIFHDKDDGTPNGTYYLVTGGSSELRIAKLKDDMITIEDDFKVWTHASGPDGQPGIPTYHEGPWMFTRRNDAGTKIYYLMYPGYGSTNRGGDMRYSMAQSPFGPWIPGGIILDPVGTGDTTHGSMVEFNGKWYMFYHNANLSQEKKGIPGGMGTLRSTCVDEVFFNADGTIQKVIQTTHAVPINGPVHNTQQETVLNNLFGAGNWELEPKDPPPPPPPPDPNDYNLDATYYAAVGDPNPNTASLGTGVTLDMGPPNNLRTGARIQLEGGILCVGHISNTGAYLQFTVDGGATGGEVALGFNYARGNNDGASMRIVVNGDTAEPYILDCPPTGGWGGPNQFQTVYTRINLNPGAGNTIRFTQGGVNVQYIEILFPK